MKAQDFKFSRTRPLHSRLDDGNDRVTTTASTASSTTARLHRHGITIVTTLHGHTVLAKPMCARWASSGLGKTGGLIADGTL